MKNKYYSLRKLNKIKNLKGEILLGLKKSDAEYKNFSEFYFSKIFYNKIKAWKIHKKATMNIVVPFGKIKFVIYDDINKTFFSETISPDNYKLLTIYPKTCFGFKGLNEPFSILANISNYVNDPNEYKNVDLNNLDYNWSL